jgi:hypothetical protein
MSRLLLVFAVLIVVLSTASVAFAGSGGSAQQGYNDAAVAAQVAVKQGPPPPTVTGSLPFTGTDLGIVSAAGVVLLATGLGLRRFARAKS